jgi:Cd2+/Zn2+-exporting ATPase
MKQNILIAVGVVLLLLSSVFFSEWMNMSIGMLVHEAQHPGGHLKRHEAAAV